ncbi:hypothetical protein EU528_09410 [Candidatus Thorarchaeota archaeon]|nr:MAG: hypothetical protein EU528_09410 [Candidatus Thorarchaeota archaeon]
MLEVKSKFTDSGFSIEFKDRLYPVTYPGDYWKKTPEQTRLALTENLALATTMHLPLVFKEPQITYHSGRPILEPYFFDNFVHDIPSCTEVDGTDTGEVVRQFLDTKYHFTNPVVTPPSEDPVEGAYRAIVGLSFGKDSLLTYAIADEIGLDPEIGYIVEESLTYEEKHKTALAEKFKKEFGKSLHILKHETGKLRDYTHLGLPFSELGWGLQSTEYALEFIPLAYALQGKYILFGNEQTTSETYLNANDGWLIYPCYDQSHAWTVQINQITQLFSAKSVNTGSLIEPLMDMMVQRTLAHRYPEIAKYQMSCFTETEAGRDYHWCHSCTVCGKMYLLCAGSGVDPKSVGFRENMLEMNKKHHFTLFGGKSALTYANTATARDEQLFAFYCAVKKDAKGALIEEFRESDLYQEAESREDELFKRFISIYEPISVPAELKTQVMSIYKEEINSFEL